LINIRKSEKMKNEKIISDERKKMISAVIAYDFFNENYLAKIPPILKMEKMKDDVASDMINDFIIKNMNCEKF